MLGDVILVSGDSKLAPLNVMAQRLVSMHWRPREEYTHVALGFGEWLAIHAMPNPWHVEVVGLHELLGPTARWRVWRNPALAASLTDTDLRQKHHFEICSALGGSYNTLFVMKDVSEASFCSQLVGRLANDLGHPFDRGSRLLMPLDIFEFVSTSDTWTEVTSEYLQRLEGDADYQRLYANTNERDALAHYAAYLITKGSINEQLRGERAAFEGILPNSRVDERRDGAFRIVSYTTGIRREEIGLDRRSTSDLPTPYRGSLLRWGDKLDILSERLEPALCAEMRGILEVQREKRIRRWPESAWTHDAVIVIGRSDLAQAAAILFDAVVPLGTDAVAASAMAFGAPTSLQQNPTLFADRVRARKGASSNAAISTTLPDGTPLHASAGDAHAEELLVARTLEDAYVRNNRPLAAGVIIELAGVGLEEPSLLLPGHSVPANVDKDAKAWRLELAGLPFVDTDCLSWEDLATLRSDTDSMASFQRPRRLLTDPRLNEAGDIADDLAAACGQLVKQAAGQGLAIRRVTLGIIFTDSFPTVGRLPELLRLLEECDGECQIIFPEGPITVRVVEVAAAMAQIAESHRHVLTLMLESSGAA